MGDMATPATFDFTEEVYETHDGTNAPVTFGSRGGVIGRPISSKEAKQIRQRARRKMRKVSDEELTLLYRKPLEDWDLEELARGRPRAVDGTFKGKAPSYIDRRVHEQIVQRFEQIVRDEMNSHTVGALKIIGEILNDDEVDEKGKPRTSPGTKLEAAKFLVEHVLGKPKQRTETDISVKLQAVLGTAMVNPSLTGGAPQLTQGYIEATSWEDDDDDDPAGD